MSPDAGQTWVGDRVVSASQKNIPPEKRNMSMIFQSYAIWLHKTVFENVAFGLELRNTPKDQLRARVNRVLEIVHWVNWVLKKQAFDLPRLSQTATVGKSHRAVALSRATWSEGFGL